MATKTTLRAEIRARRRARRAAAATDTITPPSKTNQAHTFVHHRAEAAGIASQVRTCLLYTSVAQKDSAMALSQHTPARPIDTLPFTARM